MTTRHGKIARLPHEIREELNRRLFNGIMGPELLAWLNELPAVKEVVAKFFAGAPVNRQNLADWRHGGYQDWLRHQERELRIQRLSEEGVGLKQREGAEDLFENFARIAVAELTVDMDTLDQMDREQRWERLRGLTRELARLQNGYNRSRWAELAWTKWNDLFEPVSTEVKSAATISSECAVNTSPERAAGILPTEAQNETNALASETSANPPPAEPHCEPQSQNTNEPADRKVDQGISKGEGSDERASVTRTVYHRKDCGCVCKNCHPDDGEYPYAEAVRDTMEAREHAGLSFWRGMMTIDIDPKLCDCPCVNCTRRYRFR